MQTFVTVIHVITCILLVLVVLIQAGKGAEISTSLGGSSQTVFGTSGGANFLTRFTSGAAAVFMVTSLVLTLLGGQSKKSLFETGAATTAPITQQAAPEQPKADNQAPAAAKDASQPQKTGH